MHAMAMLHTTNLASAAWGWQLSDMNATAKAALDFTCAEGNSLGCMSVMATNDTCSASNYTCTVQPKTDYSCDISATTLKCSINGASPVQPNTNLCINLGYGIHVKDSELVFDPAPSCTMGGGTPSPPSTEAAGSYRAGVSSIMLTGLIAAMLCTPA